MTQIIAVANQKGGTGKTTSAINVAAGLARFHKRRVLLIDIDPQANATAVFLGIPFAAGPRQEDVPTVYEVILGEAHIFDAVQAVELSHGRDLIELHLLPAHLDLASAEIELVNLFQRELRLQQALVPLLKEYDTIVIDCPPSLGLLTLNALVASTHVLIPVDPGVFPLIGLNLLNNTIAMVQRANPSLQIIGVLPTLVDNTALSRDTESELQSTFGDLLLPPIPRRVAIGEAHAQSMDIFSYDPKNDGARAYRKLLKEIVNRG